MGWVGVALIMVGNIWLAKQHINAFILIILGNLCWLAAGIMSRRCDMVALALTSIVIHARNYYHWKHINDFQSRNQDR